MDLQRAEKINKFEQISQVIQMFSENKENQADEENIIVQLKNIFNLMKEIKNFIKISKQILELGNEFKEEDVLSHILKVLEKMKLSKFNDTDLILKIMKILKIEEPAFILDKISSLSRTSLISTTKNEKKNN